MLSWHRRPACVREKITGGTPVPRKHGPSQTYDGKAPPDPPQRPFIPQELQALEDGRADRGAADGDADRLGDLAQPQFLLFAVSLQRVLECRRRPFRHPGKDALDVAKNA